MNGQTVIHQRVAMANAGEHPSAVIRLSSGWVVLADSQPVDGYCLLLSDPVVPSLNSLEEAARTRYCLDMLRVGDALLQVTGCARINYETWCNLDPALHTHIVPRYLSEAADKRILPVCKAYDISFARKFHEKDDAELLLRLRRELSPFAAMR